jgi:hypothetical protein
MNRRLVKTLSSLSRRLHLFGDLLHELSEKVAWLDEAMDADLARKREQDARDLKGGGPPPKDKDLVLNGRGAWINDNPRLLRQALEQTLDIKLADRPYKVYPSNRSWVAAHQLIATYSRRIGVTHGTQGKIFGISDKAAGRWSNKLKDQDQAQAPRDDLRRLDLAVCALKNQE